MARNEWDSGLQASNSYGDAYSVRRKVVWSVISAKCLLCFQKRHTLSNEGFEDCSCHHINSDTYWERFCFQLKCVCQSYSSCWLWTAAKRILRWMNCTWSCVFFLFLNGLMKILKKKAAGWNKIISMHRNELMQPADEVQNHRLKQPFCFRFFIPALQWAAPRYFLEVSLSSCITLVDMKTRYIIDAFPYSLLKLPDDIFTWQKF